MMKSKEHPERKKGEYFIGNFTEELFKKCKWKTKRKGVNAYDVFGILCRTSVPKFPVFVKQSEV